MKKCDHYIIRANDILLSLLALIFLSPVLVLVIIILRLTGEGEIFYFQERIGKSSRSFKVFKFATMLKNSPNIGTGTLTIKDDPRVLPLGRFLRKSKINELPQLWNILIGDMSLIGPRPLTTDTYSLYSVEGQELISSVRPGLSGLASICFRNEENIITDMKDPKKYYVDVISPSKESLEIWYVKNFSIMLYYKLILATILAVIFPRIEAQQLPGIKQEVHNLLHPKWLDDVK